MLGLILLLCLLTEMFLFCCCRGRGEVKPVSAVPRRFVERQRPVVPHELLARNLGPAVLQLLAADHQRRSELIGFHLKKVLCVYFLLLPWHRDSPSTRHFS